MKKIITIILISCLYLTSYSQPPTGSVTVENPRISGSNFLFDVYFMRTNSVPSWNMFGINALGNSSWFFNWNTTVLNTPTLTYVNAFLLPGGGVYTNVVGNVGGQLAITTTYLAGFPNDIPQDVWYHAFTVQCNIAGAGQSLISWDALNTGITTINASTSVTETYFDSGNDIVTNYKCWTGGVAPSPAAWDQATNWSPNGIPTTTDDIIYPNNPTLGMGGFNSGPSTYGSVQNLRVNHHAQLTVPQNHGLDVSGMTTLMGGMNIVVATGAGNGTLSSSFMPHGGITYNGFVVENGHIEVQRNLYFIDTQLPLIYYFHLVAAPVGGVLLGEWDMVQLQSYAFEYDVSTQDWVNIYNPSRSTPSAYGFILSVYDVSGAHTEYLSFYDNLLLGPVSPAVHAVANEQTLIGNPYTAPIDWDVMILLQTGINDLVRIWDPAALNYKTHIRTSPGSVSARYIQPGQGFFVEAAGATGTQFDITIAARTHTIHPYLKDEYPNRLRLYTVGGNSSSDETYIQFKDGEVTGGYDIDHDAKEWASSYPEYATEIYTVGTDSIDLCIDARPLIGDAQVDIPLHFKAGVEAEYTLGAEFLDTFEPGISILLEDKSFPGADWFDMCSGAGYEFSATPEDDYDRFVLHFYDKAFGIEENGYEAITIYSNRTNAYILNKSEQRIREILVYDIMGNLLLDKVEVNNDVTQVYVSDKTGYYVVKVITDKAVYTEKVFISK
ncbi:MAG: T9SS type A sorting domain-containing protein [Bacteroidales bacterium]|nr:T9SS type A sorting domain-containing protein [Bacteroidales bacterium]